MRRADHIRVKQLVFLREMDPQQSCELRELQAGPIRIADFIETQRKLFDLHDQGNGPIVLTAKVGSSAHAKESCGIEVEAAPSRNALRESAGEWVRSQDFPNSS